MHDYYLLIVHYKIQEILYLQAKIEYNIITPFDTYTYTMVSHGIAVIQYVLCVYN